MAHGATDGQRILLRPREVAAMLGLSRSLVYRLIQQGDLPAVRVTETCVRVALADLERFIAERRVTREAAS